MKISAAALVIVMGGSAALAQTGTLDQHSPASNASYNLDASSLIWQQQVKAGQSGQLEGIAVSLTGDAGAQAEMRVRLGGGWSTLPLAFSTMMTKTLSGPEVIFVDMTAANIQLNAGELFVMETQGNGTGMSLVGSYVEPPGDPEYPEPLFLNSSIFVPGWRHGFKSYMLQGGPVCYANCDGSTTPPILNVEDFTCFINEFAAAQTLPHEQQLTHYANCDQSSTPPVLNVEDFTCFINRFAQGCP
jgi:hypothetical protein